MTTIASYLSIANDLGKWRALTAKTPDVSLQTKYFKENLGKLSSIDAFLNNRRLFNYAMTAFGLGDMTYAKGMMRKVLEQGVDNPKALAHTLHNPNILAFAKAFDFAGKGAGVTASVALADDVAARFVEQSLQAQQGKQNPGVQLALYFRERAPSVTSVYGVLADKKLLQVVQTALDISPMTSVQPIDTQARLLKSKIDVADFQDPKKLNAFITRFAAMYDTQNAGAVSAETAGSNAILFDASRIGSDGPVGIDFSLILRLQNANRGL